MRHHEQHANAGRRSFEACNRSDLVIVILPAVLAECVFVLESYTSVQLTILLRLFDAPFRVASRSIRQPFTWTPWGDSGRQRFILLIAWLPPRPQQRTFGWQLSIAPFANSAMFSSKLPEYQKKGHDPVCAPAIICEL